MDDIFLCLSPLLAEQGIGQEITRQGPFASMIMNQQHTDQHLLSHQHDQVTHSFAGPAPSAATKAFIIYLLLFGHV